MKTLKLKFALLALVAVGMLSISSCEKEENNSNRLTLGEVGSVWQCSTEHYTITWTLLNDSTIYSIGENNSEYRIDFDGEQFYSYFIDSVNTDYKCIILPEVWIPNSGYFWVSENNRYKLNLTYSSFNIDYAGEGPAVPCEYCVDYYSFKKIK